MKKKKYKGGLIVRVVKRDRDMVLCCGKPAKGFSGREDDLTENQYRHFTFQPENEEK